MDASIGHDEKSRKPNLQVHKLFSRKIETIKSNAITAVTHAAIFE